MSADWQIGDLALCIQTGPKKLRGRIFTVRHVVVGYHEITHERDLVGLTFSDYPDPPTATAWCARGFRKIHPLTPEEYEETWTELLTTNPVKELVPIPLSERR